jgi:hypothetical protein
MGFCPAFLLPSFFTILSLFLFSAPVDAGAMDYVSIGFDDVIGKIGFASANPLRDEYAGRGVHFRGGTEKTVEPF